MTDTKRRALLKASLGMGVVGIAAGAGLLKPNAVFAAWPETAFKATTVADALQGLLGSQALVDSSAIRIRILNFGSDTRGVLCNGEELGILVSTTLVNVDSMAILIEKNPSPLAANFRLTKNTQAFIRTRIKMNSTSNVLAVVRSNGKLFVAKRHVLVGLCCYSSG